LSGSASDGGTLGPVTGAFTLTGALHTPPGWHTATLLAVGRVLIAGGGPADIEIGAIPARSSFSSAPIALRLQW